MIVFGTNTTKKNNAKKLVEFLEGANNSSDNDSSNSGTTATGAEENSNGGISLQKVMEKPRDITILNLYLQIVHETAVNSSDGGNTMLHKAIVNERTVDVGTSHKTLKVSYSSIDAPTLQDSTGAVAAAATAAATDASTGAGDGTGADTGGAAVAGGDSASDSGDNESKGQEGAKL